jgi:hypothetical protein
MKRRAALSLALLVLGAALIARPARAEPTLWERTRTPRAQRVEQTLERLERIVDGANQPESDADMTQDFRLATLALAELTGARELGDPRLLILLADVMLQADIERGQEAARLLEKARALLGPNDLYLEAQIRPLLAAAARDEPKLAIRAVTEALPLVWDSGSRSSLLRERAEARMALSDVRGSMADARLALEAASNAIDTALARFELALALERAGDLPAGLAEARFGRLTAPSLFGKELGVLEMVDIFTFRPQDADYVAALSNMAEARMTPERRRAEAEYEQASAAWARYLEHVPADDRWAPNARSYAAECEKNRARLAKAREEEPPESGAAAP